MLMLRTKQYLTAFGWLMTVMSILSGIVGMIATLKQSEDVLWTDGMHVNAMNWIQFAIAFVIFIPGATVAIAKFIALDD